MLSLHIIQRQDGCLALKISCPDHELFKLGVASLKQIIPASLRRFDFAMRYWVISPEGVEQLTNYVSRMQAAFSAEVELAEETDEELDTREAREQTRRQEQERTGPERERKAGGKKGHLRITTRMDIERAYRTLYLLSDAPPEVIQTVYRTLAKIHHPDVGGSTEAMAEINEAYNYLVDLLKKDASAA